MAEFKNNCPDDNEWSAFITSLNKWTPENYQVRELVHYIQSGPHHPAAYHTDLIEQLAIEKAKRALNIVRLDLRGEDPECYRASDLVSMGTVETALNDVIAQLEDEARNSG